MNSSALVTDCSLGEGFFSESANAEVGPTKVRANKRVRVVKTIFFFIDTAPFHYQMLKLVMIRKAHIQSYLL